MSDDKPGQDPKPTYSTSPPLWRAGCRHGYHKGVTDIVATTLPLLERALERVRHDHAWPMEVSDYHHCDGCDLEVHLQEAITQMRGAES